jgi:predicted ATPase
MLLKYTFDNKVFHFTSEKDRNPANNVFTVIVGKNGTGKSRLLSAIVKDALGIGNTSRFIIPKEASIVSSPKRDKLIFDVPPSKVITASTSPFDKFPMLRRNERLDYYSYLGLRDLHSHNFGLAYLSKIIGALISSVAGDPKQMFEISRVLNYLGYTDSIHIRIDTRITESFIKNMIDTDDPVAELENSFRRVGLSMMPVNRKFFYDEEGGIHLGRMQHFISILKDIKTEKFNRRMEIHMNIHGINLDNVFNTDIQDLIFLIDAGFLQIRAVNFQHKESLEIYSISEASSGEQCVVIGILGLASQIIDNSLILIDEPEICLHPEWQERYIKILISTFSNYHGCHFIIATHSPQIISNLESSNCYVLPMESRKIINAREVNYNSADFQLANIFNSPGFRNEYLSRIAINTFFKVSKNKLFDEEDIDNLTLLISLSKNLEINDPVYSLVNALTKMRQRYA